ncbi:MAG: hypothetical protein RRY76_01860 [Clostridia bacterium]
MKKILSMFIVLMLVFTTFSVFAGAAADTAATIKKITFESEKAGVVTAKPQGGSTLDALIDGKKLEGTTSFGTAGVVLFNNTHCTKAGEYPQFSLILELDKAVSVGSMSVSFYEEYNSMVGVSKDGMISVESSVDGKAYTIVKDFKTAATTLETEKGVQTVDLKFDAAKEAKFIKITMAFGDSPFKTDAKVIWEWIGLTEISVAPAAVVDTSSVPDTSKKPDTSKPTPETSDSGIVALAVVSVLAVAGAFLVKKYR